MKRAYIISLIILLFLASLSTIVSSNSQYVSDAASSSGQFRYDLSYYNGKLYACFHAASDYDPYFIIYNGTNWTSRQKVGEATQADPHARPTLAVGDDGRIHLTWGGHDDACKYIYSDDNGTTWSGETTYCDAGDYRHFSVFSNGDIKITYQGDGSDLKMVWSDDNGETWDSEVTLTDFGGSVKTYCEIPAGPIGESGSQINWFTACAYRGWSGPTTPTHYYEDLCVLYFNQSDEHVYSYDGIDLGTTADATELMNNCLVNGSGSHRVRECLVDNYDAVCIIDESNIENSAAKLYFYRYNGTAWSTNLVQDFGADMTMIPTLRVTDNNTFYVYGDFEIHEADGVEVYASYDNGSTWNYIENICNSTLTDMNVRAFTVENQFENVYLSLLDFKEAYDTPTNMWAYGDLGFIVNGTSIQGGEIEFISINGASNNTEIHNSTQTVNWTVVSDALQYHLEIDNNADFSSPEINYTDINQWNYPSACNINETRVSFTLPDGLNDYNIYYMRVRALIKD